MRIFIILIMVLALAISAHAALTLSLSVTGISVGNVMTLSIISDSADPWGIGDLILSEDTYNWTDPVAAMYDGSWSYHTTAGAGSVGDLGYATPYSGYAGVYKLNAAGSSVLPESGIQFSINIKGVQAGTIYISLQDDSAYHEMSSNGPLIIITPEPMTITLLALGGLLLRRRRKI
jgi:hypothetical protein